MSDLAFCRWNETEVCETSRRKHFLVSCRAQNAKVVGCGVCTVQPGINAMCKSRRLRCVHPPECVQQCNVQESKAVGSTSCRVPPCNNATGTSGRLWCLHLAQRNCAFHWLETWEPSYLFFEIPRVSELSSACSAAWRAC